MILISDLIKDSITFEVFFWKCWTAIQQFDSEFKTSFILAVFWIAQKSHKENN